MIAKRSAESSREQAQIDLEVATLDVLLDVEISYWQLAYEFARRELRQSSIDAASKLLDETEERERLGAATSVEVLRAQAALASRQEAIILADAAIARTQDELAELIGWSALADDERAVEALPEDLGATPDREVFLMNAMAFDPNRRAQLEVIRRSRLRFEQAKI